MSKLPYLGRHGWGPFVWLVMDGRKPAGYMAQVHGLGGWVFPNLRDAYKAGDRLVRILRGEYSRA